jgi:tetratricopeptide (TPR) repeat protein
MSQMRVESPPFPAAGGFLSCNFQPQSAADLGRMAAALMMQHQFAAARDKYHAAIALEPHNADFHFGLAFSKWNLSCAADAGEHLQDAIRLDPRHARAHAALASWYLIHGMSEAAEQASALAYQLEPTNLDVLSARGDVLDHHGESQAVCDLLRRAGTITEPTPGYALLNARMSKRRGNVPEALRIVQAVLKTGRAAALESSSLHLAAAGLLDGMGRYDDAFEQARLGNTIRRMPWNPQEASKLVDDTIDFFSPAKIKTLVRSIPATSVPVFVVGFVRSGTSLVEQILASHPSIYGAGELDLMHWTEQSAIKMVGGSQQQFPASLDRLTLEQANGLAQGHLGPLQSLSPQSERIIDKMPFNGLHLGLVQMLFPGARVIHCRRDPLDTCLSAYMTPFSHGNAFKYQQHHLGRFHREYERLMSHWKSTLEIPILDVSYEKLVHDVDGESHRMLQFLGMPWDDRCARFYETQRYVATASSEQVRNRPYASSIGRWKHYARHLQPLKAALGV